MVESMNANFPFHKLTYDKFLLLEVMMCVEHTAVKNFMYFLNKETRSFLKDNFIIVQNGFINEGLIIHVMKLYNFDSY